MKASQKRTRLVLGPRQVERLLVAVLTYAEEILWPEGEDEPVNAAEYREAQRLAEVIRKARDA